MNARTPAPQSITAPPARFAAPPDWPALRVTPLESLDATVQPPGSKSVTNRLLAATALSTGHSRLLDVALCEDTERMVLGLRAMGIDARLHTATRTIDIVGCGGIPPQSDIRIDAGDAGTAMRFLTALACLGHGARRLDGSERMRQRPIGPLVEGLRGLGAPLGYEQHDGFVPLVVDAHGLAGGSISFDTPPSSQFLSAILLVAPYAASDVMISVNGSLPSQPYVAMTIRTMRSLGVEVLHDDEFRRYVVAASQRYQSGEYPIEPDASGATYFWAAAAAVGGRARICGLSRDSAQGDTVFVDVLVRMGCTINVDADGIDVLGPPRGALRGIDVDLNEMPDTVQTLAVLALFANSPTRIRNVANLRIKETDRLAALATELTKVGAAVEVGPDWIEVRPPQRIIPARIATYNDHRMAMSFAVAALATDGISIESPACVAKSFPEFWGFLDAVGAKIRAD